MCPGAAVAERGRSGVRQGDAAEMRQPFLFVYMHMYVCVHIQTHIFTYIGILINTYDLKNNLMLILDFLFPTLSSIPRGLRGTWVCTELCAGAGRGCCGSATQHTHICIHSVTREHLPAAFVSLRKHPKAEKVSAVKL